MYQRPRRNNASLSIDTELLIDVSRAAVDTGYYSRNINDADMTDTLLNARDMDFLLYEFLNTESLLSLPRYSDHSREVFDATLDTAERLARNFYANHYSKGDACEPVFDGEKVQLIPEIHRAFAAVTEFGLMAAHHDAEDGGMQLPEVLCVAANAYFSAANVSTSTYHFVTMAAANLIQSFASKEQKTRFLGPMLDGRFTGTMALTEAAQGSALADIKTNAIPQEDGSYRIKGQKMWISAGDHPLTDNIVHLVLAKIRGAPEGVHGISLFIVPKVLVNEDGTMGERNDVALAGLLHKMGCRNATSTLLNFGENDGAVGYLVGEAHRGLGYMFQMMNEARVGVGMGAAVLAYRAYLYALDYARSRPQGRLPTNRDPSTTQVMIIEHADVRRMLLIQKAYAEGSLALCLYATTLVEDSKTAPTDEARKRAGTLLDLLTPIVKSWPSKYGCVSNSLAIQVLGAAGYSREHPLEQLYRDQRLNPIHEGTEGIQGVDLLGRKMSVRNPEGWGIFKQEVQASVSHASSYSDLLPLATALAGALDQLEKVTTSLQRQIRFDSDAGLANATLYLDVFGCVVMSWIWLRQSIIAQEALDTQDDSMATAEANFYRGKQQAARYFIDWELPQACQKAELLVPNSTICFDMQNTWF